MSFKRKAARNQAMRLATVTKASTKQTEYVCRTCGIHMRCTDCGPTVQMAHSVIAHKDRHGLRCSSMTFERVNAAGR